MKIIRNVLAVGLIAAASVAAAACSSQHGPSYTGSNGTTTNTNVGQTGQAGSVGTLKASWTIPPGFNYNVYNLNWTLKGSGSTAGDNYGGPVNIGDAQSAEWVAGGITAGCGYTLQVTATDSNGDPCSGTATNICINAGVVNYTQISVVCLEPNDAQAAADVNTGSLAIEAGITAQPTGAFTCPGITSFSITPAELLGTQPAVLSVQTTPSIINPDGGPLTGISWTVTGGTCSAGTLPTLTNFVATDGGGQDITDPTVAFNCGSCTGQVQVTAQVINTELQPNSATPYNVCLGAQYTSITGLINCEGGGTTICPLPTLNCAGVCVNEGTDNANCGACGATCTAPESCQSGTCACPSGEVPSGSNCCPTATPNFCGAACTSTATDVNNCGTCGNVCPAGDTCSSGTCNAAPPPPLVACTQLVGGVPEGPTGQTNCVQCSAKTGSGGVCTATEQLIVARDIGKGLLVSGQLDPVNSCYACAAGGACIDTGTHVTKNCEDLTGNVGTGAAASKTNAQLCLDTLACILGDAQQDGYTWTNNGTFVSCGNDPSPGDGISNCYCGSAFPTVPLCNGAAATAVNGACDTVIIDGLGDTSGATGTPPATVLTQNTTPSLAAGRADAFLKCAGTNAATPSCPQCYQ
jgi:hypothetical protein